MTSFEALVLGIVQGATEYVPVSSSGHLVLVPWLLGWPAPNFAYYVLVQWGTLVAVLIYFWREIAALTVAFVRGLVERKPLGTAEARLAWLILAATIPAAVLGLLFKDYFEETFSSEIAAAVQLIITGLILAASERVGRRTRKLDGLTWLDALIIGIAQAISILPGISRSGATIAGGLVRDLEREAAARFSFLLSIPALLGAGLIALPDLADSGDLSTTLTAIVVGFVASAITGYVCIYGLLAYLRRRPLYVFAVYCWLFGGLCLLVASLGAR
jgi:undecaprenyl-diphosphatase